MSSLPKLEPLKSPLMASGARPAIFHMPSCLAASINSVIESDEAFDAKTLKEHPGETGACRTFLRITRDEAAE
jgi:hypothetical protein